MSSFLEPHSITRKFHMAFSSSNAPRKNIGELRRDVFAAAYDAERTNRRHHRNDGCDRVGRRGDGRMRQRGLRASTASAGAPLPQPLSEANHQPHHPRHEAECN